MARKGEGLNFISRISNYFRSVRNELKKVSWPSRKDLKNFTAVVIVMTIILALIMGFADLIFQQVFLRLI